MTPTKTKKVPPVAFEHDGDGRVPRRGERWPASPPPPSLFDHPERDEMRDRDHEDEDES